MLASFCQGLVSFTLCAFVSISLIIQSSTAQLIEAEDEIIPSFYEWMERNSYICESGTQNLPIFLNEAETEQFNCIALCGEPMETFKACARQPSSSSNSDPICETVPEICAREFIQEFLLALGRSKGEEFMQEELDFRSLVQRATSLTRPTTSSTISTITTTPPTPSTTTAELSTTTFTPTMTSTLSTSTTSQSTTTTSRQTTTSISTTTAPITSVSSTVTTTSTIAPSTPRSSATSDPTTTISVPTIMTTNSPSSSTTTQFSTATSTTDFSITTKGAEPIHSENKTIQSAVDGDTAPVRELLAIDGDANASVDSTPPARISRLLEKFRTAIARTPEPLFETVFRGKLLLPTGDNDKSCPPDRNESCKFWAQVGECMQNPRYMLRLCRRACGVCGQVQKQKPQDDIRVS